MQKLPIQTHPKNERRKVKTIIWTPLIFGENVRRVGDVDDHFSSRIREHVPASFVARDVHIEYAGFGKCDDEIEQGDNFEFQGFQLTVVTATRDKRRLGCSIVVTEGWQVRAVAYPPITSAA